MSTPKLGRSVGGMLLTLAVVVATGCATAPAPSQPSQPPAAAPTAPAQAPAESAADFYKGRQMTWIVPFGPGGGADTYSRLYAKELEKRLGVNVLVKNQVGAGGLTATNALYLSKGDGLTVGLLPSGGIAMAQTLKDAAVRFDLGKFALLAGISQDAPYVEVGPKSPFQSWEDMIKGKKTHFVWAVTGKGTNDYYRQVITSELVGLENVTMASGYGGSAEVVVAIERGDAHGTTYSLEAAKVGQSSLKPIAILNPNRSKEYPNLPTVYEVPGMTPELKAMADFLMGIALSPYTIAAPPGVPEDRVKLLAGAVEEISNNPEVQANAAKVKQPIVYRNRAEITKLVAQDMMGASPELVTRIASLVNKY